MPYTEDPAELRGSTSRSSARPPTTWSPTGRAPASARGRSAPRAARRARTWRRRWTASRSSRSSTTATPPSCPPTRPAPTRRSSARSARCVDAGAIPIVLGGDHGIAEPDIRACAAKHGPVGLIHFDTHTDTGKEVFGVEVSHGTPMYRLVEQGHVDPKRYVQIGLRGYWPGDRRSSAGRTRRGSPRLHARRARARDRRRDRARRPRSPATGPTFLSVDVDVLDPAFAPGTGTPEPGGMTSTDLLRACRELAARVRARRRRRGRGDPDRRRLRRHHGPGRRPHRARDRRPGSPSARRPRRGRRSPRRARGRGSPRPSSAPRACGADVVDAQHVRAVGVGDHVGGDRPAEPLVHRRPVSLPMKLLRELPNTIGRPSSRSSPSRRSAPGCARPSCRSRSRDRPRSAPRPRPPRPRTRSAPTGTP